MLKILQARLQQYVNRDLPNVQTGFRKGKGTRDQTANIHLIIEKASEFQKSSTASLTTLKPLTVWITANCGKFSGGRSGGLVFPSLSEFSTVCCDPQSQRL